MALQLTDVEFKRRFEQRFGKHWLTRKSRYINMSTPVELRCKIHGVFLAKPSQILFRAKNPCSKCAWEAHLSQ